MTAIGKEALSQQRGALIKKKTNRNMLNRDKIKSGCYLHRGSLSTDENIDQDKSKQKKEKTWTNRNKSKKGLLMAKRLPLNRGEH